MSAVNWIKRQTLKLAFMGAAATATYHYGTKERDIRVRIEESTGAVIKTDAGTFVNTASPIFHGKTDEKTAAIGDKLVAGAEVDITVYGLSWLFKRNIVAVRVVSVPLAVNLPEHIPEIAADLRALARLPITGKPVFDVVTNPDHGIEAFMRPWDGDNVLGFYVGGTVNFETGVGTATTYHEYFHAAQDINDGDRSVYELTIDDAIFYGLLEEACARAYEFACLREAKNRGITLRALSVAEDEWGAVMQVVFDGAYTKAWNNAHALSPEMREHCALQAGAQQVTRFLMEGGIKGWTEGYTAQVVNNLSENIGLFLLQGLRSEAEYKSFRSDLFAKAGYVSDKFNLSPAVYLGEDADIYVQKTLSSIVSDQDKPASDKVTARRVAGVKL